ncbi:MAG: flagellar basal body L-ring protein FlgH [Alphaproteobacteria bacterium]|nr:flagellar basal body L-ring protein FlgH [Alphaproteobacteria bacterium]
MTLRPRASPAAVLLILGGGVGGCTAVPPSESKMLADLAHLPGDQATETPVTNGAIYQGNVQGAGLELFRDHRVWQVGDIVTVHIVQAATATKNVSQNLGRNDSVSSSLNNLVGLPTTFGKSSKSTKFNPNVSYTSANSLQGSGATAQSDSFATTVSTMVQRIRPNGDLVIAGNDEVKLVGGKEYIRIAGVVRPEDLSGNIVESTQMAEAHIEFSGDGETYLAPKMGFVQRLFLTVSSAWPGDWFN